IRVSRVIPPNFEIYIWIVFSQLREKDRFYPLDNFSALRAVVSAVRSESPFPVKFRSPYPAPPEKDAPPSDTRIPAAVPLLPSRTAAAQSSQSASSRTHSIPPGCALHRAQKSPNPQTSKPHTK